MNFEKYFKTLLNLNFLPSLLTLWRILEGTKKGCGVLEVRQLRRLTFELSPAAQGCPGVFLGAGRRAGQSGLTSSGCDTLDSLVIPQGCHFQGVMIFPKLFLAKLSTGDLVCLLFERPFQTFERTVNRLICPGLTARQLWSSVWLFIEIVASCSVASCHSHSFSWVCGTLNLLEGKNIKVLFLEIVSSCPKNRQFQSWIMEQTVIRWRKRAVLVSWGCHNQTSPAKGFNNRNSLFHRSGGHKSKLTVSAGLVSYEMSLLGCRELASCHVLTWCPLRVCTYDVSGSEFPVLIKTLVIMLG